MSEYQYYEFQALDRPLSDKEMAQVRRLSTRAEITRTSFTNEYHWGDFRGDPLEMMKKWYDAHLYFANWGTHQLMLRLPRALVDVEAMQPYVTGEGLDLHLTKEHVIVAFSADREAPDWDEVECSLAPLLPLRDALLAGDLRPLYLGWLACLQSDYLDEDAPEPPIPAGMGKLSGPLRALAEFLWIEDDLLELAAEKSRTDAPTDITEDDVAAWVVAQPTALKDEWLRRLVGDDAASLRRELWRQARLARAPVRTAALSGPTPRTVAQLREALDERREATRQREEQERQRRREEAERKRAAERTKHLNALAAREEAAWREVDQLVATSQPKSYDQAVALLRDLRDLARREGHEDAAQTRIRDVRQRFARKRTFLQRLDRAGLPG
jgi:hypothetical protein